MATSAIGTAITSHEVSTRCTVNAPARLPANVAATEGSRGRSAT